MPVLIGSLENPTREDRCDECFPDYNSDKKEFSLNRPIGDDWGQYIRHRPQPSPIFVRTEARIMFVIFELEKDAIQFNTWIHDAAKEQRHGFSTMRG